MRKMADGGKLTTGAMARLLSDQFHRPISRNAVCGKLKRLGLEAKAGKRLAAEKPKPAPKTKQEPKPKPKLAAVGRNVLVRLHSAPPLPPRAEPVRRRAPDPDPVLRPDGKRHTLETLPRTGCRWIIAGEGVAAEFCARQHTEHSPYCEAHTARAWRRQINTEEQEEAA